jgi:hypothetical protein
MLNEDSPEEFRALVMNYYRNMLEADYENSKIKNALARTDDRKERFREQQAKQMASEIGQHSEEDQKELLAQLKGTSPEIYKKVLNYLYDKYVGATFRKFSYKGSIYPKYIKEILYRLSSDDIKFNGNHDLTNPWIETTYISRFLDGTLVELKHVNYHRYNLQLPFYDHYHYFVLKN